MISQTKANVLLNYLVGLSAPSAMSTVYLGLCATAPSATQGEVTDEPTAESYSRKAIKNASQNFFGNAVGGVITNSTEIQMNTARENMGKMNYWFLSESSSGNAFLWGFLYDVDGNAGIDILAETVPVFYEKQLKASIDVAL